jgi:hypothetical protein
MQGAKTTSKQSILSDDGTSIAPERNISYREETNPPTSQPTTQKENSINATYQNTATTRTNSKRNYPWPRTDKKKVSYLHSGLSY